MLFASPDYHVRHAQAARAYGMGGEALVNMINAQKRRPTSAEQVSCTSPCSIECSHQFDMFLHGAHCAFAPHSGTWYCSSNATIRLNQHCPMHSTWPMSSRKWGDMPTLWISTSGSAESAGHLERTLRLGSLAHPAAVAVFDVGDSDRRMDGQAKANSPNFTGAPSPSPFCCLLKLCCM